MIEQVTEVVEDQSLFYIGEQSQMESYDQDIIRYFLEVLLNRSVVGILDFLTIHINFFNLKNAIFIRFPADLFSKLRQS